MTTDEQDNWVGSDIEEMAATSAMEEATDEKSPPPRATGDLLRKKKARESEVNLTLRTDADEPAEFTLLMRAIGQDEYDDMLAEHPPTAEQRKKNLSYNPRSFAPCLLARVCVEPRLDEAEWQSIWTSPDWNRGELNKLFAAATDVCNSGFDIPFIGLG